MASCGIQPQASLTVPNIMASAFAMSVGPDSLKKAGLLIFSGCHADIKERIEGVTHPDSGPSTHTQVTIVLNSILDKMDEAGSTTKCVVCPPFLQFLLDAFKQLGKTSGMGFPTVTGANLKDALLLLFSGLSLETLNVFLKVINGETSRDRRVSDKIITILNHKFKYMILHAQTQLANCQDAKREQDLELSTSMLQKARDDLRRFENKQLRDAQERLWREDNDRRQTQTELEQARAVLKRAETAYSRAVEEVKLNEAFMEAQKNVLKEHKHIDEILAGRHQQLNRDRVNVDTQIVEEQVVIRRARNEAADQLAQQLSDMKRVHEERLRIIIGVANLPSHEGRTQQLVVARHVQHVAFIDEHALQEAFDHESAPQLAARREAFEHESAQHLAARREPFDYKCAHLLATHQEASEREIANILAVPQEAFDRDSARLLAARQKDFDRESVRLLAARQEASDHECALLLAASFQ